MKRPNLVRLRTQCRAESAKEKLEKGRRGEPQVLEGGSHPEAATVTSPPMRFSIAGSWFSKLCGRGSIAIVSLPAALSVPAACFRWTRAFARPLKSLRVVVSGLKGGGFWFQPGLSMVSSVREGQFMVARTARHLLFLSQSREDDAGLIRPLQSGANRRSKVRDTMTIEYPVSVWSVRVCPTFVMVSGGERLEPMAL